ncbi:MAG: hypothetical protein Q8L95_10160 [Burkholderiales bacterium]|nr:hypothetical protein [Burkholderiales bacterium]
MLAFLSAYAAATPAWAGRPLQTEDAGVLETKRCEVEGAAVRQSGSGVVARENSLQLGCGVGASTQLALAVLRSSADDQGESGLHLSGKTGLWVGAGEAAPALTLAYALSANRASSASWRHAASAVNLVYSRPAAADLTLHVNLGHARDEVARQPSTTWGLALEHAGFGALAPMVEVFGDDREAPYWNVGLRYTLQPEKGYLDVSYGRQISATRSSLASLGFKIVF